MNPHAVKLAQIIPLLQVSNMAETLNYYEHALGFITDLVWPAEGPPQWARVSRDGVSFIVTKDLGTSSAPFIAEKGNGVVFYLIAGNVAALYEELATRGAIIVQELQEFGGRQQFTVADPNGYVLAFSQAFSQPPSR